MRQGLAETEFVGRDIRLQRLLEKMRTGPSITQLNPQSRRVLTNSQAMSGWFGSAISDGENPRTRVSDSVPKISAK
jgi:hypothetical protein